MSYKPIEDYGMIGDLETVALVGMDGVDRLPVLPALRLADRVRGAARRREGRALQHRARPRPTPAEADVPAGHQRPGDALPVRGGRRRGHRLHAGRRRAPRARDRASRDVRARAVDVPGALRAALRLRPRRRTGEVRAGRGRVPLARRGRVGLRLRAAGAAGDRGRRRGRRVRRCRPGETVDFVLEACGARPPERRRRPGWVDRRLRRDRRVLARAGWRIPLPGTLARDGRSARR